MDNRKSESITKKIKVYGIVQGVGFRPLVYRIAQKWDIKGSVRNVGGYVEIIAQAKHEILDAFIGELRENQGNGCEIIKLEAEVIIAQELSDFVIIHSESSDEISIIPPDLPVCQSCSEELYHSQDRRFLNPFISCMSCGPRYTIMEDLPYDRCNTTMKDFEMCPECNQEYVSPKSRRFHAQTISCNDCGPYLIYHQCKIEYNDFYGSEDSGSQDNRNEDNRSENNRNEDNRIAENNNLNIRVDKKQDNINVNNIDRKLIQGLGTITEHNKLSILSEDTKYHVNSPYDLVNQEALEHAVTAIKNGGIIAVKGIGGYHFVCSPFIEETVLNLRKLKGREEKPFAVMFPSMDEIEKYCTVTEKEKALLHTTPRPIVLLYMKANHMAPSVHKNSIYCGAFLPYTPLQQLLTDSCGPLIMTSANISDQPVIREEEKLFRIDSPFLTGILYNTRRIIRSVDDSVAKVIDNKPQLIRRSRGYVPYPVFLGRDNTESLSSDTTIFAAGGDLKAAFCLTKGHNAVVSQYFGDLEEVSVMEEYKSSYQDLTRLLKIKPSFAVYDLHPNYHSSHFTKSLGIPGVAVQHHHAHIASVMAEHDLKGRVIGVAFDGTGYGTDGNIWGGEFLFCEGAEFIRAVHLNYVKILGGDQSMKDAKKTETCYLLGNELEDYVTDERKNIIKAALKQGINTVLTSSMGRMFDVVASILNLCNENRYEGECAAVLEKEAVLALKNQVIPEKLSFSINEKDEIIEIDSKLVLEALCKLRGISDTQALALGFHYAVAELIVNICDRMRTSFDTDTVALSGGVFQNSILTEHSLELLRQRGFKVYVNLAVPPNDGGISLGQTYLGRRKAAEATKVIGRADQTTGIIMY